MNPDVIEYIKLQLAPTIPASAPITLANNSVEILSRNIYETFNDFSKLSKEATCLLRFFPISFLSLISAKK